MKAFTTPISEDQVLEILQMQGPEDCNHPQLAAVLSLLKIGEKLKAENLKIRAQLLAVRR